MHRLLRRQLQDSAEEAPERGPAPRGERGARSGGLGAGHPLQGAEDFGRAVGTCTAVALVGGVAVHGCSINEVPCGAYAGFRIKHMWCWLLGMATFGCGMWG